MGSEECSIAFLLAISSLLHCLDVNLTRLSNRRFRRDISFHFRIEHLDLK